MLFLGFIFLDLTFLCNIVKLRDENIDVWHRVNLTLSKIYHLGWGTALYSPAIISCR